ncbi:RDD family protein [Paraferrimonas sedimenticola]|uniref:RDD family protein n=1 Tax=Paraferrimonas sedimenticola TaxID=375674 RepID=UPI001FE633EC|nr:RDD family protein [Paraferrimonas sedimenticola]
MVVMGEMRYAGFFPRVGAFLLDRVIFLPFILFAIWGNEQSRLFQLYWLVPGILVGLMYHVYLVQRFGATPGKLLLKIRIAQLDGSKVGLKQAFLRYSVTFALTLVASLSIVSVTLHMTDELYFSMGWMERSLYITDHPDSWYYYANIGVSIWVTSEFIVMLTNKKRRALQDFIAGTVVVRKSSAKPAP